MINFAQASLEDIVAASHMDILAFVRDSPQHAAMAIHWLAKAAIGRSVPAPMCVDPAEWTATYRAALTGILAGCDSHYDDVDRVHARATAHANKLHGGLLAVRSVP